jgi:hypothetical protein
MAENKETTPKTTKGTLTLGYNSDGVMGSTTTENNVAQNTKSNTQEVPPNKVAIFSNRNLYADGYGNLNVGYNIVGNRTAAFWLSQKGVRLVEPEELAEAFG